MPWLAWPCIDWLERAISPGMKVFEYGGGGSTVFFLSHGCQVTTVEGNSRWAAAIRARAAPFGDRLDLRYVDSQTPDPELRRSYAAQASLGGPWDLILCCHYLHRPLFPAIAAALAPGGLFVFTQPTRTNLERHARPGAPFLLIGVE